MVFDPRGQRRQLHEAFICASAFADWFGDHQRHDRAGPGSRVVSTTESAQFYLPNLTESKSKAKPKSNLI